MARWFFVVSFFVACLLYVTQAFPQSMDGSTDSTTPSKIESALTDVVESLQKGLKQIMDDPGLNKLVQDGQKFLENAATSIQNEAAKIVPKTE